MGRKRVENTEMKKEDNRKEEVREREVYGGEIER